MKKKFLITLAIILLLTMCYGVISWKVFQKKTFLSFQVDCFPKLCTTEEKCNTFNPWEFLFGLKCVSY
jgi:hypothetical protein